MKFSTWVEHRNQKSQMKMPRTKSREERIVDDAKSRIHSMAGVGKNKTYGRAGAIKSDKDKGSRAKSKAELKRTLGREDS